MGYNLKQIIDISQISIKCLSNVNFTLDEEPKANEILNQMRKYPDIFEKPIIHYIARRAANKIDPILKNCGYYK